MLCLDHDAPGVSSLPRSDEPTPTINQQVSARGGGDSLAVPALSSRPSATRKLYIDFDGQTQLRWGSWAGIGGKLTGNTPAFNTDSDPNNFSDEEREQIRQIWAIAAEKFSIFDLDVTTVDPGPMRDGAVCKVVVGGDGMWYGEGGGVAILGGFNGGVHDNDNVGWVWDGQGDGGDVIYIGEGVAHEAGHMFGLSHQSTYSSGSLVAEYRYGPIMGGGSNGDGDPGARWWVGDSSGRDWYDDSIDHRGIQNDIPGLVAGGLPLIPDDFGNTTAAASNVPLSPVGATRHGRLHAESDVDFFRIQPSIGALTRLSVLTPELGAMLNPVLTLYSASGTVLATSDSGAVYDESLSIPAASGGVYYVGVSSKVVSLSGISVGSYTLSIDTTGPEDNSFTSARIFEKFGEMPMTDPNNVAWGRSVFNGTLGGGDTEDWYAFRVYARSNFTATLTGLSGNADLQVLVDADGSRIVGDVPGDILAQGTNTGSTAELTTGTFYISGVFYYLRVFSPSGATTNYTLTFTNDRPIDGETSPALGRARESGYVRGEHVSASDSDTWFATSTADLSASEVLRVEVSPISASVIAEVGYDLNGNRLLDASEIITSLTATTSTPAVFPVIAPRDASGRSALMRVRSSSATNYRTITSIDFMPMHSIDINDLQFVRPLFDFNGSRHGASVSDFLDGNDIADAISLGVPPPGPFQAQATMLDTGPSHTFQLIRDLNANGQVDAGEIVATGANINYNVASGNTAPFFFRVLRDGQNTSVGHYRINLRDDYVGSTFGPTIGKPRQLGSPANGTQNGFVGSSTTAFLHRPADYFAFTLANKSRFNASLSPQRPGEGALSDAIGLKIVRDLNNNGQIDANEPIINYAPGALNATLDAGNYFVGVIASPAEGVAELLFDYKLNYSTSAVTDSTPVQFLAAEYLFETRDAHGLKLVFSEDVSMSLDASDIVITHVPSGQNFVPTGSVYDPQTFTVGLSLPVGLWDGNYEVTIGAGRIADPSGNQLAATTTKSFYALAGDANRDRTVNFEDLLIVAQSYGQSGRTFSQGNFNYDLNAAVSFDDLLMVAQRYGTSVQVAAPAKMQRATVRKSQDVLM